MVMNKHAGSPAICIRNVGKFKLKFFSSDEGEPPHVHAFREDRVAKFWLAPVRRARSTKGKPMKPLEAREAFRFVEEHEAIILATWHGFFAGRGA